MNSGHHAILPFEVKRGEIQNAYYWKEIITTVEFFNCFFEFERGGDFGSDF